MGQQTSGREISFPTTIKWNKQKGVTTYRLQIAGDESFRDIFLDRRITAERYVISNIPAGYYYWRVTPIGGGPVNFSRPVRFFISGGVVTTIRLGKRATVSGMLAASASQRIR